MYFMLLQSFGPQLSLLKQKLKCPSEYLFVFHRRKKVWNDMRVNGDRMFFFERTIYLGFAYSDVLLSDLLQRLPGTFPL